MVNLSDTHHPGHETSGSPSPHEAVHASSEANADGCGGDGAVDDIKDGVVQVSQRAALEPTNTTTGDCGTGLGNKVSTINVPRTVWPNKGVLWVASDHGSSLSGGYEAREVKGTQLHVGDGNVKRPKLCGQNLSKGGESRANGGFGSVEGRVNGRNDGWREDKNLGRDPFLPNRLKSRRQKRQEGLDCEDRLEKMRVEEVGEAGRWDSGNGRSLIVETRNQNNSL